MKLYSTTEIEQMSVEQLKNARLYFENWIAGPENNGRTTADSSASLDMAQDSIEVIDRELEKRNKQ